MYNTPPPNIVTTSADTGAVHGYNTRASARAALAFEVPFTQPPPSIRDSDPVQVMDQTLNLAERFSLPSGTISSNATSSLQGARGTNLRDAVGPLPLSTIDARQIQTQISQSMSALSKEMLELFKSELARREEATRPLEPTWPRDLPPLAQEPRADGQNRQFSVPPPRLSGRPPPGPPPASEDMWHVSQNTDRHNFPSEHGQTGPP